MTTATFTPPSPGSWELEQTHMTRPPSMLMAAIFPDAMMRGFAESMRTYGALLDHLEVAVINRFLYLAVRPVGVPKGATAPPPRLVFKAMCLLHPELRRRIRRSAEVFRERTWRSEIEWWDREVKPSLAAEAKALLAEDVRRLSNEDLAAHVRRAIEFLKRGVYTHHRFNGCAMIALGDFLVHAMDWTGLGAAELLEPMRGLSPVSAGAVEELSDLRRALLADADALSLVLSDQPPAAILADLERRQTPVGAAARADLEVVGLRVLGGYDVSDRHAREHPELLVKVLRTTVSGDAAGRHASAEQKLASVRARVPAAHRDEFDALFEEARATYRIRDERVFHSDALAIGIARRAILAAGERLKAQGLVSDPAHLVDATPAELLSLMEHGSGPSAAELAERTRWRVQTPMSAAPDRLGHPPSAPPPIEWMPPAAARLQRGIGLVLGLMFDVQAAPAKDTPQLKGFPVSSGAYEGAVRVIRSVDELPSVQAGEILVATSTGPTFNVVLPLIGVLVTERGGMLSHAAIVSREYGLPGVVGCTGATSMLKTGMRARVDGNSGEVWIVG